MLVNVVRAARPNPFAFLYGELLKLLMTALLLWLLSWLAQGWLVWPAVLLGLVFTLKGYLLLLICASARSDINHREKVRLHRGTGTQQTG
ncbi:hypothetical protein NB2BOR_A02650 [Bordetella parapertussis]|nr:hypothetical protein NB2BOR_A02650 [Bordetella parapertussis]